MRIGVFMSLCLLVYFFKDTGSEHVRKNQRGARKLFGGYRITPRYCKPTHPQPNPQGGPSICMFNHECRQKDGVVVGACMDGFLFGACCQLKQGVTVGDYLDEDITQELIENNLSTKSPDITSAGVSQIAQTLLNPGLLSTLLNKESDNYYKPEVSSSTQIVGISLANAPPEYTTVTEINRPLFKPKPIKPNNNYVRVPTITHETTGDTQTPTEVIITSRKPPSTSYVFSTTPFKSTQTYLNIQKTTSKPTKKPSTQFMSSTTKTTWSYSPSAFITTSKPPSTSYVYSSLPPSRKPPPTTLNSYVSGPGYTSSSPSSTIVTPTPTIIILGPISNDVKTEKPKPTTYEHYQQQQQSTALPTRKPINHLTINQHLVQNIYGSSTESPQHTQVINESPSPTILITPKPSISSIRPPDYSDTIEISAPSSDDLSNFPPVRNPNLNLSHISTINENDITTPSFIEDDNLNANVESFVNQIIAGLQEPFQGLKDVVNNKKNISLLPIGTTTTKRPLRLTTVTKGSITTVKSTTSKPVTTSRPIKKKTNTTTKKPYTTTKKVKSTKKPVTTTTQSFIEHVTDNIAIDPEDYKTVCGIRPLVRSAKIVGGKGTIFGEFPWQVLVRESTWLGLFTKNKCGGVLISHKYVMTAAHCQPGFLASLVAVFGEFDISGDLEKRRTSSRNVKRVIVHRQYDQQTFENDLALLELEQPVQFDQHIIPICLPRSDEDFTGRMATVTGWGRLKYGGGVPSVLQEVQVPIMENHVCQEMFRTAGHSKVILDSFLCAGYANGQKDSCEGDSGGPLVLQRPDGRYQLAGTVSHGIKCAAPYLPGVYMRTQFFKPWITSITGVTSP